MSRLYLLLGRQIAHYRRKAGLTQEELAERTAYSVDFIGLVERGINAPTVERLEDIARAVGVEVWELFRPPDNERPNQPHRKQRRKKPRDLTE